MPKKVVIVNYCACADGRHNHTDMAGTMARIFQAYGGHRVEVIEDLPEDQEANMVLFLCGYFVSAARQYKMLHPEAKVVVFLSGDIPGEPYVIDPLWVMRNLDPGKLL